MSILNYQLLDDHLATAEERVMAFVICVEKVSRMIIINTIQNYPWLQKKIKRRRKETINIDQFFVLISGVAVRNIQIIVTPRLKYP